MVAVYVLRAANEAANQARGGGASPPGGAWAAFLLGRHAAGFKDAGAAASTAGRVIGAAGALATAAYLVFALLAPGLSAIAVIGYGAAFVPVS